MKSKSSNSWFSWKDRSTGGIRTFSKVDSEEYSPGKTPVYLNVYDLTFANDCLYWAGIGAFHTGIEAHGTEYAFGAHEYPASGIFEVDPHECPGFKFRKSILMGYTGLDDDQVRDFMELHSLKYHGNTYHLIYKNCNHFCADLCRKLTGNPIPKWVNRLAKIGSKCSSVLPRALKGADAKTIESKKLKTSISCSSSSCFSSIWITHNQKEVKASSQQLEA